MKGAEQWRGKRWKTNAIDERVVSVLVGLFVVHVCALETAHWLPPPCSNTFCFTCAHSAQFNP
jgi:hypothetical protein